MKMFAAPRGSETSAAPVQWVRDRAVLRRLVLRVVRHLFGSPPQTPAVCRPEEFGRSSLIEECGTDARRVRSRSWPACSDARMRVSAFGF